MAKTRVVGLDIGTTGVRAVELEHAGRGAQPVLHRFGHVPLPPGAVQDAEVSEPETVATALRQLWKTAGFKTRDVVIGVGNQRIAVREVDLPHLPMAQIRATLPFQVQELLPMPVEEALLDFYPAQQIEGPTGRLVRGVLVAAVRSTVQANVMAVESAGLRPQVVDLNAFALLRATAGRDLAQQVVAVVDVGARMTTVVISAHGAPRLVRTVPSGGQDVTDALAGHLQITGPDAEALKREIGVGMQVSPDLQAGAAAISEVTRTLVEAVRNTFVYYQGNNPGAGIDIVLLTGGGAHLPGLGQYLSTSSRLPVAFGDPLAGLRISSSVAASLPPAPFVAVSVGLASAVAA